MSGLFYRKKYMKVKDEIFLASHVVKSLREKVSSERWEKIQQVAQQRTYDFVPVVEKIYDRGNINAVMRSAEAYGFMNFHIIENPEDKFKRANRVSQGTDKWLDIEKHRSSREALLLLKNRGYQVYCTSLQENSKQIGDIDFSKPTALVFGNEKDGVSQEALDASDGAVLLPMKGFAQSFNISVAAAISFQYVQRERELLSLSQRQISFEEESVKASYLMQTVESWEKILLRERADGEI